MHAKFIPTAVALTLFVPLSPAQAQSTLAESRFNADTEGWTVVKSAGEIPFAPFGSVPISWVATGGNPSGFIHQVDPNENRTSFWKAPATFLGNKSGAYGGTLSYDLRFSHATPTAEARGRDVVLVGGGMNLAYTASQFPGTNWTHFEVALTESGWHLDNSAGLDVTQAQMQQVLGALTAIYIRAEYRRGDETDDLDNVVLRGQQTTAPPAGNSGGGLGGLATPNLCGSCGNGLAAMMPLMLAAWAAARSRPRRNRRAR